MIGLGTFYNALGVVFGGLLGLLIGQRLSEDFHETPSESDRSCCFCLGHCRDLGKNAGGAWKSCGKSRQYDVDSESSDRDRYRGTLED